MPAFPVRLCVTSSAKHMKRYERYPSARAYSSMSRSGARQNKQSMAEAVPALLSLRPAGRGSEAGLVEAPWLQRVVLQGVPAATGVVASLCADIIVRIRAFEPAAIRPALPVEVWGRARLRALVLHRRPVAPIGPMAGWIPTAPESLTTRLVDSEGTTAVVTH
eukprot:CAMPEP_0115298134 /NCGR_PEP_ID=MMETSP0270-20121206/68105_1 /TAXON_ID=71861 /ORGANISM="Scrippsiella trochoidea, Strain CCMP3099" /LENGTH=162 /DNA_ID=CAMNT_0002715809 /DNA_START=1 /DNA_END=489 /DNA_ORIENTATION=+